jgi:hypothetical protein
VSARNSRTVRGGRPGGHPARDALAAEVRELGLMLMAAHHDDDVMMQHGTAALWVSVHGHVFTRRAGPLPAGIQAGRRGKCFANAQLVARAHGLRYVEGFAGPSPAGEWTLHAWNADSCGRVIDPPGRTTRAPAAVISASGSVTSLRASRPEYRCSSTSWAGSWSRSTIGQEG